MLHVWYIYLYEWLISMVNVGKYTSPMDPMGYTDWFMTGSLFHGL